MNQIPKTPQDLFLQAVEQVPADQWPEFLDRACGGDAVLRMQVERLLAAHGDAGSFMKNPAAEPNPTVVQSVTERPGDSIGPYRLLEQIGEGGFGVVFMAEQTAPVKRKVALKVIKPGMDTREVIARFDAERQALALMDHPNIAKVFDAGATAAGRPFFVMELVRGTPITTYCDQNQLSPRERLELFVSVCQAVQHAHQKGIIHRDIKPTNVLVTQHDDRPVVKMIDFGIAKATSGQLTDKTLFTGFAQLVGTPLYMSPEQASLNSHDIDTRSDIYSLGVLLYELLTGTTPFDRARLERAAFDEIRRIIREEEPSKPSTRLSELGAPTRQDSHSSASKSSLASIAAQRHTEPNKLAQLLRGDLDWIVMKALEKDRSRRYETANGFAADVLHYLADEPVTACPPSFGYRFRKFARRNKGALAVGALISTILVAAVVVLAVSNLRVIKERNAKDQALGEKQAALGEKQEALDQSQKHLAESKRQEKLANDHARTAEANAQTAKEQEQLAKRRYYAAQMNLAMRAWQEGEAPRVLELLEGQRPLAGEEDLRGFEWYYLWRLVNGGRRQFEGHEDAIMALAFSPDGKSLFSAAWDWTVRKWDVDSAREEFRFGGTSPWTLVTSPDGRWLAGGSWFENSFYIWEASGGAPVCELPGPVANLYFSADSGSLWSGGDEVRQWAIPEGEEIRRIPHPGGLLGISVDGKVGATLVDYFKITSAVNLWKTDGGELVTSFQFPHAFTAAMSRDRARIAVGGLNDVKVWDVASRQPIAEYSIRRKARSLAFSPDGDRLVCGCEDRRVILWDIPSGKQLGEEVHRDVVWAVCFSPDGGSIASGSLGGDIKLWTVHPIDEAVVVPVKDAVTMQFTPDSRTLLVGADGPMSVIDVVDGRSAALIPVAGVRSITPDGRFIGSLQDNRLVAIRELAKPGDRVTFEIMNPLGQPGLQLSDDGRLAAVFASWGASIGSDHRLQIRDVSVNASRSLVVDPKPMHLHSILCADFSPDGRFIAAGYQFHWFSVWDVVSGEIVLKHEHEPAMNLITSVQFSPDSRLLAVGADTGTVWVWNLETGRQVAELRGHTSNVSSLSFSTDGQTLATAGADLVVRLWDVRTGQERCTLSGHQGAVHRVQFAPDGKTLATVSREDGTIRLWRAATDDGGLVPAIDPGIVSPDVPSFQLPLDAVRLTESEPRGAESRVPNDVESIGNMLHQSPQNQGKPQEPQTPVPE